MKDDKKSWVAVLVGTAITLTVVYFSFRAASAGWNDGK